MTNGAAVRPSRAPSTFKRLTSTPSELLRYFFSRRDISLFVPTKDIPSSKAMRDQKALSLSLVHSWLQRCLVRGRILDYVPAGQLLVKSDRNGDVIKMTDAEQLAAEWEIPSVKDHIYPAFSQYCKELGGKMISDNQFWKELHKVFRPEGSAESTLVCHRTRMKAQVEGHTKNGTQSLQKQMMTFPSLETSRKLFCENVAHESKWSFDAQGETNVQDEGAQYDNEQLGLKQVFV